MIIHSAYAFPSHHVAAVEQAPNPSPSPTNTQQEVERLKEADPKGVPKEVSKQTSDNRRKQADQNFDAHPISAVRNFFNTYGDDILHGVEAAAVGVATIAVGIVTFGAAS